MSATYVECPKCGKRALSVATRCPQCGFEYPSQPVRRPAATSDFGRLRPLLAVAAVLVATTGLVFMVVRRTSERRTPEPPPIAASGVPVDPPMTLDTAQAAASPPLPDSMPGPAARRRYARTWTNVRSRRSAQADVVAVLLPGDTVLADSLSWGWWRVALDGRVLGYVWASTLVGD